MTSYLKKGLMGKYKEAGDAFSHGRQYDDTATDYAVNIGDYTTVNDGDLYVEVNEDIIGTLSGIGDDSGDLADIGDGFNEEGYEDDTGSEAIIVETDPFCWYQWEDEETCSIGVEQHYAECPFSAGSVPGEWYVIHENAGQVGSYYMGFARKVLRWSKDIACNDGAPSDSVAVKCTLADDVNAATTTCPSGYVAMTSTSSSNSGTYSMSFTCEQSCPSEVQGQYQACTGWQQSNCSSGNTDTGTGTGTTGSTTGTGSSSWSCSSSCPSDVEGAYRACLGWKQANC